jgi:signal transduction histidine kinase
MMRKNSESDTFLENLKLIETQIHRISTVTKDMMDFARVRPAAKTDLDINEVINKALRLASFDKSFQQLRIEVNLAQDLPPIHADSDQLSQVFLNLMLNARDAMPNGGMLSIETVRDGYEIRIAITDTGVGIRSNDVKQIFDPFFTTKPAGHGTGLGLAVCYGIITAHGGRIEAVSGEAAGTTFKIVLPAASEPSA